MGGFIEKIKDAISPMKYGTGTEKVLYWFIKVTSILVPVLIVCCIIGVVYCKIKGIDIALPF